MERILSVTALPPTRLSLRFEGGATYEVDLSDLLTQGFTTELRAWESFKMVTLEPGGGVAWPNGFDICPNFLRELAASQLALT